MRKTTGKKILVSDLKMEYEAISGDIEKAVIRTLRRGFYILGKEVELFEREFAAYCGSTYAIGVASGTDALSLSLKALGVGYGDEVITQVNTAIPTAMAIASTGAKPVFVDVEENTFNMDTGKLKAAITKRTKAVIPVSLFGNPYDIDGVSRAAKRYGLFIVEDACQAHGALYKGRKIGTFGITGAFSFYPTKNLGCFGDGGAVVTNNRRIAEKIKLLRNYGQASRYTSLIQGINSRLDELQAAALRIKLKNLEGYVKRRIEIADLYDECLKDVDEIRTPIVNDNVRHAFHLYVIRCSERDGLRAHLAKKNIETQIHYPTPLHLQKAFRYLGYKKGDFPVAEALSKEILSLPIFTSLGNSAVKKICSHIKSFYANQKNTS